MSMRSSFVRLVAVVCLTLSAEAARQSPGRQPTPQFRAGVELVQVDVSVLDRNRQPVRGLTVEDFSILEDGTPHPVAAFSEIVVADADPPPTPWMREVAPDVRRNDESRDKRLTVIVMDDMTMPFDIAMIKSAKAIGRRVVDEMGAADLAAVVFTRSNREAQDFTGERSRLIAAVDTFAPGSRALHPAEEDQQEYYFLASLDTLRRAAELLAAIPQRRKTLVYVSTGIPFDPEAAAEVVLIGPGEGQRAAVARRDLHNRLRRELEDIFREAQRANVNIYSVDPSGLGGMEAATQLALARGSVFGTVAAGDQLQTASRQSTLHAEMLRAVANNTGGRAFLNTNEFDAAVQQIFVENGSYYLLGYRSMNQKRNGGFRRVEVKVNRPDVDVRARAGYYGPREDEARRAAGPASELDKALASLLPKGDLPMQVSAVPFAKPGSIDSSVAIVLGLRQPAPGGAARVTEQVNLAVNAYGPEGQPRGSHRLKAELQLRPVPGGEVQYEVLSQIDLRPGRYQLRLAAESTMLARAGSVFYDIDVPDFSRPALSLSGVTMTVAPALAAAPKDRLASLLPLVPTTQRDFLKTDKVSAFLRVYQSGRRAVMPITLDARVLDATGRVVFGGPQKLGADRFATNQPAAIDAPPSFGRPRMGATPRAANASSDVPHAADVLLDLPVFSFGQGPHVLIVDVTNGNETARRDVRFRIH